jgi:ribosomal protein L18
MDITTLAAFHELDAAVVEMGSNENENNQKKGQLVGRKSSESYSRQGRAICCCQRGRYEYGRKEP